MSVVKAINPPVRRFMALDCSTNSVAFAIVQDDKLDTYGEIVFKGKTTFSRLKNGAATIASCQEIFSGVERIYIEGATYVQNKKTVILLAYAFGAILSAMPLADVVEVSPMTWQNKIGNKALTKDEKAAIRAKNPNQRENWYKNKFREFRKQRTASWVQDRIGVAIDNDNVTDAIAIALSQLI